MPIKALFLGLFLGLSSTVLAAQAAYPELEQSYDSRLHDRLESKLQQLGLLQAALEKRLSVAVADITDLAHPRFAAINPNHMAYAASLPKIAILLGAFARVEAGEMQLDQPTRDSLTRMIRVSSNRDASEMLERVGTRYLADLLQSPNYRLYDPARNGGLWAGKPYGKEGATLRDPLHNLSHGATALQVARFYYLLETGQLVSAGLTREMKSILGDPALHHKFVGGLQAVHPEARLYRKSGTWKNWHADSAIVERDGRRYIAVALAEDAQGESWLRRVIVGLDEAVAESAPLRMAQLE
ncbi:MAG: serine hydrolase [Pseudomonadota bacterium]